MCVALLLSRPMASDVLGEVRVAWITHNHNHILTQSEYCVVNKENACKKKVCKQ